MIQGEIKRYLRDNTLIRVSRSTKDLAYKAIMKRDELTGVLGYVPSTSEIANSLGESEYNILNSIEAISDPVSIFDPIYNDSGDTIYLYEQLEDKKQTDIGLEIAIRNEFDNLSKREKDILNKRYLVGKTQMEISKELNISQAQVSRIESEAINTLRKKLK